MRKNLQEVLRAQLLAKRPPGHAGLTHERWAWPRPEPGARNAKEQQREWDEWLSWVEGVQVPEGYDVALRRWRRTLAGEETRQWIARAPGRLLVGHGNPSGTEVGLTLHHTWGVPMLPGSALKGLTAHYVETVYGPEEPDGESQPARAPFQGVTWEEGRMKRGPGWVYRQLFGAPDLDPPGPHTGATEGSILFHDALLWVPSPGEGEPARRLLARDVLTVHHKEYYRGGNDWPNDYDPPNPVAFLTVAPGTRFLLALSVRPGTEQGGALLALARRFLSEALEKWGVGGKSAAGYGRLVPEPEAPAPAARASPELEALAAWLEAHKAENQRQTLQRVEQEWLPRLRALPAPERERASHLLRRYLKSPKLEEERKRLLGRLASSAEE